MTEKHDCRPYIRRAPPRDDSTLSRSDVDVSVVVGEPRPVSPHPEPAVHLGDVVAQALLHRRPRIDASDSATLASLALPDSPDPLDRTERLDSFMTRSDSTLPADFDFPLHDCTPYSHVHVRSFSTHGHLSAAKGSSSTSHALTSD